MVNKLTVCSAVITLLLVLIGAFAVSEQPPMEITTDEQTPSEIQQDPAIDDPEEMELDELDEDELPDDVDIEELLDEDIDEEPVIDTDTFTLKVSGQQSWGIRLGFGDRRALRAVGLSPGVPTLEQSLRADIEGTALGFLTLEASFNDQLGPGFQHLAIKLDHGPWTGELGDFSAGVPELGVYDKKLLGTRLTYTGDGFTVTGVAAREQGISEERVFRGRSADAEDQFSYRDPDRPGERAPYRASVLGVYHIELRRPYVEGFSELTLSFPEDEELTEFLTRYDLGYLEEVIGPEPERKVDSGNITVLSDEGEDILLLRNEPRTLLRRRVRDAIDEYNERHGLTDEDRKRYPFVSGSELEEEFLGALEERSTFLMDEETYPPEDLSRRRYLILRQGDVIEGTLQVQVRRPGDERFLPGDDPALADYDWTLFSEEGVLRMDFPEDFYRENAGLRAEYEYRREGNVFALGLSVVPDSERAYVNGRRLTRDQDYTIDYESGMLILFSPLAADEELRVEFERQRGELGVAADYERGVFAVTLSVPGFEGLEIALAQAADVGRPRPDTPTMPSTHSVVGMRLTGDLGGWDYKFTLGGSENVYPPGEDMRIPGPNEMNAVVSAKGGGVEYAVFGHRNGLTVYDGRDYSHYGAASVGGRIVRDLLALTDSLLVASDAGLTLVHLTHEAPFDRVGSWVRLRPDRPGVGFPSEDVVALAQGGGKIYAAEPESVAYVPLEKMERPDAWERWPVPPDSGDPTALLWADDNLYLGTESGLYRRNEDDADWERVTAVSGEVHDLLWHEGELFVATRRGVRVIRDGRGAGWIARDDKILSLAVFDGSLWYAGPAGLWRQDDLQPTVDVPLRAIGPARGALWAAGTADQEHRLDLWRVRDEAELLPPEETDIEGRDVGKFRDPDEVHTARGITGGMVLSRQMGDWELQVDASSRWPGYLEIGRSVGADDHGLGFSLHYDGDNPWSGRIQGRWELSQLDADPRGALTSRFDLGWSDGASYTLRLTPRLRGDGLLGTDRLDTGYRLSATWPGDEWSGGIVIAGDARLPETTTSGKLEAKTTVNPLPVVAIDLEAFRPYASDGATGDQGADFTLRWSDSGAGLAWSATWRENLRHKLETEDVRWERSIQGTLRWGELTFGAVKWTPQLRLTWEDTQREDKAQAQLTGGLNFGDSVMQLGATVAHGYRPATERTERSLSTNVQWEYRGWPTLTPSLRWQGSWQLLTHPAYDEPVLDERHDLRGQLDWEFEEGWRNRLEFSYRTRDATLEIKNSLSIPTDWGTATVESKAEWRRGTLEGTASASSSWRLADMWSARFSLGYAMSWRPGDAPAHGIHAGASLTASF